LETNRSPRGALFKIGQLLQRYLAIIYVK
jgi:hypothetical protein